MEQQFNHHHCAHRRHFETDDLRQWLSGIEEHLDRWHRRKQNMERNRIQYVVESFSGPSHQLDETTQQHYNAKSAIGCIRPTSVQLRSWRP